MSFAATPVRRMYVRIRILMKTAPFIKPQTCFRDFIRNRIYFQQYHFGGFGYKTLQNPVAMSFPPKRLIYGKVFYINIIAELPVRDKTDETAIFGIGVQMVVQAGESIVLLFIGPLFKN